jgi:hypothetical protein
MARSAEKGLRQHQARPLRVIREIAEVSVDRRAEICRSELADQRRERPHFTGCHQLRLLSLNLNEAFSASRTSLRAPIISMT